MTMISRFAVWRGRASDLTREANNEPITARSLIMQRYDWPSLFAGLATLWAHCILTSDMINQSIHELSVSARNNSSCHSKHFCALNTHHFIIWFWQQMQPWLPNFRHIMMWNLLQKFAFFSCFSGALAKVLSVKCTKASTKRVSMTLWKWLWQSKRCLKWVLTRQNWTSSWRP